MAVSNRWPAALALAAVLIAGPALAQSDLKEVASPGAARDQAKAFRTDTFEMELAPAKDMMRRNEAEYSVRMKAGDTLVYSLTAPGGVYQEFHGHTKEAVSFYRKAEGAAQHGQLAAPFDGLHGWYLENRTDKRIKVRLRISGFYEVIPAGEEGNEYGIEPVKD